MSAEQLEAAGNMTRLFGQSAKRLNRLTRDRRFKDESEWKAQISLRLRQNFHRELEEFARKQ